MGIYDPVLQAYQHGVDQRIQLASQPMTLAQSILGGYQQGFGNRMQRERMDLERQQLEEARRRAMASEEESRRWHQTQGQERLLRQYQDSVIENPEQAASMRQGLVGQGMDPSIASGLIRDPQKDPYAKGSIDLGSGELPLEPLQPGTQGYEGEYIPQMGGKALLKQKALDQRGEELDWRKVMQQGQLDNQTMTALTRSGVGLATIRKIDEAIRMGRSLEPFKQDLMRAQAWSLMNPASRQASAVMEGMTTGQESGIVRLLTALINSETQQRNADVRDVPGSLGVTPKTERVDPVANIDVDRLMGLLKKAGLGKGSGAFKGKKESKSGVPSVPKEQKSDDVPEGFQEF